MKRQIYHDLYHATEYLEAALKETDVVVMKPQLQLALNMLHSAFKRETAIRRKDDRRDEGSCGNPSDSCRNNLADKT